RRRPSSSALFPYTPLFRSEAAAEPGAVGREAVVQFAAHRAQLLAQAVDVAAESGKVLGDGQFPLCRDEQARRLALRFAKPEDLRQRDGLAVAFVAEHAQDHAVAGGVA